MILYIKQTPRLSRKPVLPMLTTTLFLSEASPTFLSFRQQNRSPLSTAPKKIIAAPDKNTHGRPTFISASILAILTRIRQNYPTTHRKSLLIKIRPRDNIDNGRWEPRVCSRGHRREQRSVVVAGKKIPAVQSPEAMSRCRVIASPIFPCSARCFSRAMRRIARSVLFRSVMDTKRGGSSSLRAVGFF